MLKYRLGSAPALSKKRSRAILQCTKQTDVANGLIWTYRLDLTLIVLRLIVVTLIVVTLSFVILVPTSGCKYK